MPVMLDPTYKKTVPEMRRHLKSVLGFVSESLIREYAEGRKQAKIHADILKLTNVVDGDVAKAIEVCKKELKREMFHNGSCKKCRQSALANRLKTLEAML